MEAESDDLMLKLSELLEASPPPAQAPSTSHVRQSSPDLIVCIVAPPSTLGLNAGMFKCPRSPSKTKQQGFGVNQQT